MNIRVKAKYVNGALLPLETLPLQEGQEVFVSVEDAKGHEPAGPSLYDLLQGFHATHPGANQVEVPQDASINYKHYIYGWPKEDAV